MSGLIPGNKLYFRRGKTVDANEIAAAARRIREELESRLPNTEIVQLLDDYIDYSSVGAVGRTYKFFPRVSQQLYLYIKSLYGVDVSKMFLYLTIIKSLLRTMESVSFHDLPFTVKHEQMRSYERMVNKKTYDDSWLNFDSDLYHKEYGLASLRIYSGGARIIDPNGGIPRLIMFKKPFFNTLKHIRMLLRVGGFKNFFAIHAHKFQMKDFTEEGHETLYKCCAELYTVHQSVIGMLGCSWFYDPQLAVVSPHLAYLRDVPVRNNAVTFYFDEGKDITESALVRSKERQLAFNQKRYKPQSHMLVWPKICQCEYVSRNK